MTEIIPQMLKRIIKSTGIRLLIRACVIIFFVILSVYIVLFLFEKNDNNVEIIAEYQIPFADRGSHLNRLELLEKDEYGRCLYAYESSVYTNAFRDYIGYKNGNSSVFVYIIIQKADKDFIYCYNDVCYAYAKSFENHDAELINHLKLSNDWETDINSERLTAYSKAIFDSEVKEYRIYNVENVLLDKLEKTLKYEIDDYFLDAIFLTDGTPVFILREVLGRDETEKIMYGKSYIFYVTKEQSEIIYSELSNDIQFWNTEISTFKNRLSIE